MQRGDAGVQHFYSETDRLAGGIHGEDRRGNRIFYNFVTMETGCVRVKTSAIKRGDCSSEDIASVAVLGICRTKHEPASFPQMNVDQIYCGKKQYPVLLVDMESGRSQ